jgi:N6-L-threonylcarbamoyladenine synthase
MIILGIESSCDETAGAIIKVTGTKFNIMSNIVSSQIDIHQKYGGVVPEVAARNHVEISSRLSTRL